MLKHAIRQLAARAGYEIRPLHAPPDPLTYDADFLRTSNNHDFLQDPAFIAAYRRGTQAAETDYQWRWRVHVGLWAASHAAHLEGDFVECGVHRGFLSSAIMTWLNWNTLDRRFFLFDTWSGLDERLLDGEEKQAGKMDFSRRFYSDCFETVQANFAEFKNVQLVRGPVPDTLRTVQIEKVCYLSIDMNCAAPEIAAAIYFWDKLSPGAIVLLDDYGFRGYEVQKRAFDQFSAERGVKILTSPTGQGLMIKP